MRCPYCTSEIADEALACPNCTRDLYLFKPLLARIERLEQEDAERIRAATADAGARIEALERELAALREAAARAPAARAPDDAGFALAAARTMVPALLLLLAAHVVLLFVYDVRPVLLRVTTILVPVPFGFLLASRRPGAFWASVAAGFVAAIAAVWGMLAVTGAIDQVPVLPQSARDVREVIEYVASIGLAFATGATIGELFAALGGKGPPPNRVIRIVARAVTPDEKGTLGIEKAASSFDRIVKIVTPVATAAASLYAGFKAFFGDG